MTRKFRQRRSGLGATLGIALSTLASAQVSAAEKAADHGTDVADLSLEDLLNVQTAVATKTVVSSVEIPNIVTIIPRQLLMESGARDLLDVLMLVPGFAPGVDVQSVIGLGFRGNWGHEGKVLLLMDGQEMNEALYSTVPLGNRFMVDLLERVEIIRGPGSVIYGGSAELAVINLVTRGPEQEGASASFTHGSNAKAYARRNLNVTAGGKLSFLPEVAVSVSGWVGRGNRSDQIYSDVYGNAASMAGTTALDPTHLNLALRYKGLTARFIYDQYYQTQQDGLAVLGPRPFSQFFTAVIADVAYDFKILDNLTVTPRLNFRSQVPWYAPDPTTDPFYQKDDQRVLGSVTVNWTPVAGLNLLAGGQEYLERSRLLYSPTDPAERYSNGLSSVRYHNLALFMQALWDNPIVNVSAGLRYENHSAFGPSLVPRLGLTRQFGRFHAKLLFADSFRAPNVENINLALSGIVPERTRIFEAEVGWQFTDHFYVAVNGFDLTIEKPIVYAYDPTADVESYINANRAGSRGFEGEVKMKYPWGWAQATYAFYATGNKNQVALYEVPGHPELLLGMPQHKVTLSGGFHPLIRQLTVSPSMVFMSERYATFFADSLGQTYVQPDSPQLLLNLYVSYSDLLVKGLDLGAGVYNLLGRNFVFPQPYRSDHAPLPGLSREFMIRISYTL